MTDAQQEFSGTMAVRDQHAFDEKALEAYLAKRLPGFEGPLTVQQFKGGQSNPSYKLVTPKRAYVLRRKPPGELLPSAHAVDREYRVISALADTDVPVPKAHLLWEDSDVIGTAFYVMDFVAGRILWDPQLPGIDPAERAAIFDAENAVMAALHQVDYQAVGLGDFGKTGNYLARQINRWSKQYKASETETIEAMDNLIAWLPENIPPGDETTLVHGDYRLDNMVLHPTEPKVLAVLDWELSTLGHPLADFTYHCMIWRLGPDVFRGLGGVDVKALGIPTEAEYVAAYCRRTGRERIEHFDFYMAYNMFRLAGILQGIMGRVVAGTAASAQALESGRRARPLAELAWQEVLKLTGGKP
ncbi:phosphotransferase [Oceanibacterium hippocampi]|uniref:Putative aminoglycoside phosphotransferase n=1 Tax=Oceanibacterium hippocampi TaxID=745714 RepID=A0A1Y5S5N2_9PROT|nr:phosphotransferase [Oceanibacterium hippocampi]SLN33028.1 Putative aminoglycoside phosphotransferase [Oceanibacterium hippocampi]